MKIYTKSGDKGETGLIGGKRVLKSNQRIIAYGCIDELNSGIGLTISLLRQNSKNIFADIIDILTKIQNDLFIVGADQQIRLMIFRKPLQEYATKRRIQK